MIRSFPWPHGDVKCFPAVVDVLWDCGQRGSVVHQIHSPSLPDSQFGVAARSLGRDHAPERIDLYPAGTPRPLTMIDIHVSREPERCVGDQTITGSHKTINFAGRRSPHRVRGKLNPFLLSLYCRPLGHHAILEKLPKRDGQSPGERDNADLAATHSSTGKALPPPRRQLALRLVAQPGPGQLDQRLPRQLRPGLADAAIPADIAARVWSRRQPDERRQVSSRVETAVIDFGNEKERGGGADPAEGDQPLRFVLGWKWACGLNKGSLTIEFDLGDELLDTFVAAQEPSDFAPEIRRHRPSITGAMLVEMNGPSSAYPLAGDHNAVQRAQAFDTSDKPCALVDEGLALAAEPFGVLFLDGWNADLSRYRAVAAEPGSQDACHPFRVEPIGLGPPTAAWLQEARWIEHHCSDADLQQEAGQPKAIVTYLVANRKLERAAESKFRPNPLPIEPLYQARVIARLDRVQAPFGTLGWCKRAKPFRLAEFERDATNILHISDLRHGNDLRLLRRKLSGNLAAAPRLHRIYYDADLRWHSPDASDTAVTERVMTVMLAEEY
jgi:hypothetical protein